jgi:uncharacterized protein YpmS
MTRKLRIAAAGLLTVAVLVVGLIGGAYYASRQVRPFYRQALAIEPEVLKRGSRELESRATALYSDARQQGQWHALFTAEQINGWLATQLASKENDTLPKNIRDPRVAIADDVLTLGFTTINGSVETIISVDASVFLTAEGDVAIRLLSVKAGALPLPVMQIADQLATACNKLSLPVRWTQQQGEPVALVELHSADSSNKHEFHIDTIDLGDSELYVSGHTELSADNQTSLPPTGGAFDGINREIAIDDYELRLTSKHKSGALEVARRSEKSAVRSPTRQQGN